MNFPRVSAKHPGAVLDETPLAVLVASGAAIDGWPLLCRPGAMGAVEMSGFAQFFFGVPYFEATISCISDGFHA